MWFHLKSFFLSLCGMLIILMSFPVTQIIYKGIFRVDMFSSLNQLVIFIVLGIAADNIFVFCDAWRQSGMVPCMKDNDHRRMAYAFRRAAGAIAVTASTTSVAFAANGFSPIIPIRAFGIYASIIVLVNYAMVVLIMPSVQIIYERKFAHKCGCCKTCGCGDGLTKRLKACCACLRECCKKSKEAESEDSDEIRTNIDLEKVTSLEEISKKIDEVKKKKPMEKRVVIEIDATQRDNADVKISTTHSISLMK